jgi:hypothetical protein
MDLLEQRLGANENPAVWTSMLLDLRNLRMVADRKRAADFARELMRKEPSAFCSIEGLLFLAWAHRSFPQDISETCLEIWRARDWEGCDQGIGEFAALRSIQIPDDHVFRRVVDKALATKKATPRTNAIRAGVAYAAINLWREPALKRSCQAIIVRLLPLLTEELAKILTDIFRVGHPMPPDRYTVELLTSVIGEPRMLACHSVLARRLNELLADGLDARLVARAANAILDVRDHAIGHLGNRWAADSGYLVKISTTLQKMDIARAAGLDLFERLMDLGAFEVDAVLREVDRKIL